MDPVRLVREHGALLQSARGPIPNLAELVVGAPIRGSWWGHPRNHEIFAAINRARASPVVVAMRLVNNKVTLVHRQLWPALARLAPRLAAGALDAMHEEHLPSGAHQTTLTVFPGWVPAEVMATARGLTDASAREQLPDPLAAAILPSP
jgi:hypothetical protein